MNKYHFLMKLKNAQVFLGDFKTTQDVTSAFEVKNEDMNGVFILLAWYEIDGYEGDAFVLFEHGDKLYEVNGGHCSCNGLEGQWRPEETTAEALLHRLNNGGLGRNYYDGNTFGDYLRKMLEGW